MIIFSRHCLESSERSYCICWQTNDALVAPLLRLKDNSCHIDESERVLKDAHKYSELVILYEKKGLHCKGSTLVMFTAYHYYSKVIISASFLYFCEFKLLD